MGGLRLAHSGAGTRSPGAGPCRRLTNWCARPVDRALRHIPPNNEEVELTEWLSNTLKPCRDAGDLQRYPTTREIVGAALAHGAALAVGPTRSCPNYAVPCEDLDGNPHRLVVVALGGRIALVGPGGVTAVLCAEAVSALGDPLEDILVAKVHGGEVRTGDVEVAAKHEVFISERANVSVIARPYTETIELNFEFLSAPPHLLPHAGPDPRARTDAGRRRNHHARLAQEHQRNRQRTGYRGHRGLS